MRNKGLSLSFSRHGAAQYWCPVALQGRMADVCLGSYFSVGKMDANSSVSSSCLQSCRPPAPLQVSTHISCVPTVHSWIHILDILSKVLKETCARMSTVGLCVVPGKYWSLWEEACKISSPPVRATRRWQ